MQGSAVPFSYIYRQHTSFLPHFTQNPTHNTLLHPIHRQLVEQRRIRIPLRRLPLEARAGHPRGQGLEEGKRVDEVRAVDAGLGHGVEGALRAGDEGVVVGGHFVAVADAEDDAAGGARGEFC